MKQRFARISGVVAIAVLTQVLVAAPAMAEGEQDCICIVAAGTVGSVTSATGWVKLNGDTGLVDASSNAPLSLGSVLKTGPAGSASATVGGGCNVSVAALSQMSITALEDGRMCVRVTQEEPVAGIDPLVVVGGVTALAVGVVVVGLGQDDPVSE